jgi:hypothetical protein
MQALHLFGYTITFAPAYAIEFINEMWAKEPVASLGICISAISITLTLSFKLLDWWWDVLKERSRQGKLTIELEAALTPQGKVALIAVISNVGREPIVVRDIGFAKPRMLGKEFVAIASPESPLPYALNARALVRVPITEDVSNLHQLVDSFRVKDSLGKVWDAPEGEIRKARKALRRIQGDAAKKMTELTQKQALLQKLQSAPPLTTQN